MSVEIKKGERSFKKVSLVDPFTGLDTKVTGEILGPAVETYNLRPLLGVELDKETGETHIVETGVEDTDKMIQEFKDDCGFEGMRKLIQTGQARAVDFFDDGQHSADTVGLPDNVHDAYRAAMASDRASADLFAKLGVSKVYNDDGSLNIEATEANLNKGLKAYLENLAKKAEGDPTDGSK